MLFDFGDIVTVQLCNDANQIVEGTIVGYSTFMGSKEYLIEPLCFDSIQGCFLLEECFLLEWPASETKFDKVGHRDSRDAVGKKVISRLSFGCVWWEEKYLQKSGENNSGDEDRGGLRFL